MLVILTMRVVTERILTDTVLDCCRAFLHTGDKGLRRVSDVRKPAVGSRTPPAAKRVTRVRISE